MKLRNLSVGRRSSLRISPWNVSNHSANNLQSRLADMEAIKIEAKSSYKRNRTSTFGPTRPAKVVRTASGNSYVELDDSSDDAEIVKVESCSSRKSKAPAEIEVIDLFD